MKNLVLAAAASIAVTACNPQARQQPNDKWQAYIDRSEKEWAALATDKDAVLLKRILADDYVGVSEAGTVRNKQQEIDYWTKQPNDFASATVPKMTYQSYGHTILARGDQTLTPKSGAPARIIWTDTWMLRDGEWQVVGSQDAAVPAKPGDDMG